MEEGTIKSAMTSSLLCLKCSLRREEERGGREEEEQVPSNQP
jgi:hypothetical protein